MQNNDKDLQEAKKRNQQSAQGSAMNSAAFNQQDLEEAKQLNKQSAQGTTGSAGMASGTPSAFSNSISGMNTAGAFELEEAKKENQKSEGKKKSQ